MPLTEHLRELRHRLKIIVLVVFGLFWVIFLFSGRLVELVKGMMVPTQATLIVMKPLELIFVRLKLSLVGAILLGLPLIIYETFKFLAPGLYAGERKFFIRVVPTSACLLLVGGAFSYLVISKLNPFLLEYTSGAGIESLWTLEKFLDYLLGMAAAFGFIFQFPLILYLLAKAELVSLAYLKKKRIYAYALILTSMLVVLPGLFLFRLAIAAIIIVIYEVFLLWAGRAKPAQPSP